MAIPVSTNLDFSFAYFHSQVWHENRKQAEGGGGGLSDAATHSTVIQLCCAVADCENTVSPDFNFAPPAGTEGGKEGNASLVCFV